jgi:hypothetical protein
MASLDPQTQIREGVFYFLTSSTTQFSSPLTIDGGTTDEVINVEANSTTYTLNVNGNTVNTITQDKDGVSFALPSKTLLTSTAAGTVLNTPLTVTTYPATNTYFDIIPSATSTTLAQEGGTAVASITLTNNGIVQTSNTLNVSTSLTVGPTANQTVITPSSYLFQANGATTGGMLYEVGTLKLANTLNISTGPSISIDAGGGTQILKDAIINGNVTVTGTLGATSGPVRSGVGPQSVSLTGVPGGGTVSSGGTLSVQLGPSGAGITIDGDGNIGFGAPGDLTFTAAGNILLTADGVFINGAVIPTATVWAYAMGTDQFINMNSAPFSGTFAAWNSVIYENPNYVGQLSNDKYKWEAPLSGWYSITVTLTGQAQDNTNYLAMQLVRTGSQVSSIGNILYNWMAVYAGGKLSTVRGTQTFTGQFTTYLAALDEVIMMGGQAGNNNAWQNASGLTQMNIELLATA